MSDRPLSSSLNHYTIAKTLGSRLKSVGEVQFGAFGLRRAHAEWALVADDSIPSSLNISNDDSDRIILQVADKVRGVPYGREYILALALRRNAFHKGCRDAGLGLPEEVLNARLLALAGPRSHEQFPISQSLTVQANTLKYLRVFEFAASKLRYEYGASLDGVLTQPDIGAEFDKLCAIAIPTGLKSNDFRLSALAIRHSCLIDPAELGSAAIDARHLERVSRSLGELSNLTPDAVPEEPGIVILVEHHGPTVNMLYIEGTNDTRMVASSFLSGGVLKMMKGEFWQPNPATLSLRCITAETLDPATFPQTLLRLIETERPVFNVPLTKPNQASGVR